jgi:hypothetical protein
MAKSGRTESEIARLPQQLLAYNSKAPPFSKQYGGAGFLPYCWWSTLATDTHTDVIKDLALLMLDILPHSAATERTFSIAGWLHSKTRNRMSVSTTGKLSAIKLHYNAQRPEAPPSVPQQLQIPARRRALVLLRSCVTLLLLVEK